MKKLIPFSLVAIVTLTSFNSSARAEVDYRNAGFGCAAGALILGGGNLAQGNSAKVVAGAGAAGCAVGGLIANGVMTPAHAEEAPSEMDLKADDLKTLQDSQDLKNE